MRRSALLIAVVNEALRSNPSLATIKNQAIE